MAAPAQIDYDALAAKHGASDSQIDYDALAAKHGAVSTAPETTSQPQVKGFLQSLGETLPGYHADDSFGAIKDFGKGIYHIFSHPADSANLTYHGIIDPMQMTNEDAIARMKKAGVWNKINGAVEYAESGVPFLGPALAKGGQQMESGDIAGGLGTTLGTAIALFGPKVAKEVPGAIQGTGEALNAARSEAARMAVSPLARKPPTATMEDINFGRGGGAGIANEGLVAGSRPSLVNKINGRLGELSDALDKQLQNHPNANAQIDAEPIIDKNIDAGIKAAKKLGDAGKETRLENLRTALKTEYGPLQGTPFEMNNLKRDIGESGSDLGAFKHTDPNEASAAKAMGGIYSDIKNAVNAQIPEAIPLNQRMADLISDRMGVKRNIALNANKSPFSVIGPGHMAAKALEATVGSVPVRTSAARILNAGNVLDAPIIRTTPFAAQPPQTLAATGTEGPVSPITGGPLARADQFFRRSADIAPPEAISSTLKDAGWTYGGRSNMGLTEIKQPGTNISVTLRDSELTPAQVKARIAAKLKEFGK